MSTLTRRARSAAIVAALALGVTPLAVAAGAGATPTPSGPPAAESSAAPAGAATSSASKAKKRKDVRLRLFALNDFHGQLDVVPAATSSSGRINSTPAGGAAYLATHLKQLRAQARKKDQRTLTVAAGDLIGATPLLSAAFYDEPTIEAMNRIGLDVASVGNHEFDEGYRELRRLQRGGCKDDGPLGADNANSCPDEGRPFTGADFRYLAANVKLQGTDRTLFPAYKIKKVRGIKVGFIGLTLEDTPNIVTAEGVEGLRFTDEVRTVRKLMPELRRKGVRSIVVLLHEGAVPGDVTQYDGCAGVTGDGRTIARRLPAAVDVVVSGHTHSAYNCKVRDPRGNLRLFTSAASVGRLVTDISLRIDRRTGDVVRPAARARNRIVTNSDPSAANRGMTRLIERYEELVRDIAERVIGQLDGVDTLLREPDANGLDSPLGNLIADSQLADPSTTPEGGTAPTIALMNPGGIRADLTENANGDVTFAAAFSVQPFNNFLVSKTFTGAELLQVLNEQFEGDNEGDYTVLQVAGLTYTWDESEAAAVGGAAVTAGDVLAVQEVGGALEPLDLDAEYRVVINSFLAGGGDGLPTLGMGANPYFGGLDIDALATYLTASSPYAAEDTDRISSTP